MRERGIVFTITSGRPPFGMRMLVEPLGLTMPMAAFNGGVVVLPDLSILDERLLPDYVLPALIDMILAHGLDVWLFRATDWCVRSPTAPRVSRETSTIQCPPVVVPNFDGVLTGVVKIVGVSDDHPRVAACEAAVQKEFGTQVSAARSQPHYLDVTHPTANKGVVIERLSRYLNIPLDRIATLGDQPNDVLMFRKSGLSIAMDNASEEVKRQATFVTTSHGEEGFANAVEKFILPRAEKAVGPAVKPTGQLHRHGSEPLARQHHARSAEQRHARSLHSRTLGHRAYLESDDLRASDQQLARRTMRRSARVAKKGMPAEDLFVELALEDLTRAADLFRPIYDRTNGMDGWVSLEVSPLLAYDTAGTLAAAKQLFSQGGPPQPDDQDPRDPGGTAGNRRGDLCRYPDQRDLVVLPRALLRCCRSVPARHRTSH